MDNTKRVKYGCYGVNVTMAVVGNLSPVLFLTFRSLYGISYSLLGTLVLVNFCTQLTIDLVFSFFSHKFNIPKTVKFTPVLAIVGLILYALFPYFLPDLAYLGLVLGTIVFSAASGLAEVLISPTIAALPADNPDHEMSKLHSIYAWGVVGVIVVSTAFLLLFGNENWHWLAILFTLVPFFACLFYAKAEMPQMQTSEKTSGALAQLKNKTLWLCLIAIFLGGASECTMAQWASGYLEQALGIEKVWGDIFGVALFGAALGLGRSLYAKIGKNVGRALCLGSIGATACYLLAALSPFPILGLLACAFTGFCASMLWPGSLIVAADKIPQGGVFLYAMMAAGGDLGASVAPQLVGVVTDVVIASERGASLAQTLGLTVEQLGMKAGMLVGMIFPLVAIFVFAYIWKGQKKKSLPLQN